MRLPSIFFVVIAALTGCYGHIDGNPSADDVDAGVDPGSEAADPCTEVCSGVERDHELKVTDGNYGSSEASTWATCYSCRCKSALKELPTPAELQCSSAEGPLARYRPLRDDTDAAVVNSVIQLDPNGTDTTDCLNPGMAAAGCDLQSRFKRMLKNDGKTEFQQLCRKRDVGSNGYYEYLLIGHNQENGATCFWQARDNTFGGEDVPTLDLVAATSAEKKKYAETFYLYSEGPSKCTSCHNTDAFLTSPYLTSAWSLAQANADPMTRSRIAASKPYKIVSADQARPTMVEQGEDLAAPGKPLQQCGSCHKVSKGQYCGFAQQSIVENRVPGLTTLDKEVLTDVARPMISWMPPGSTSSHAQLLQLQQTVRDACNAP